MTNSGNELSGFATIGALVVGFGGYWLFRFSGVPFHTMVSAVSAMAIALGIGAPLGLVVGHLLSSDGQVDTKAYKIVAWGNLVGWLVPAIGMCLSFITWQFSRRSEESPYFYKILSNIGGLLAMTSAAIGAVRLI